MVIPVAAAAAGGLMSALAPAAIGAAGTIASGLLGRSTQSTPDNSTFYQNWRNDDMAWAREQFDRNEALQREFAQNGIRWRAADAKAAGFHPLAALGSTGASASPISVGGGGSYSVDMGRSSSTGPDFRGLGQDLSRAYLATRTKEEQVLSAFEVARQAQQLQHGDLLNENLRLEIARNQKALLGSPGMPSNTMNTKLGEYEKKPYEVVTGNPQMPHAAAGPPAPEVEYRTSDSTRGSVSAKPAAGMNIDEIGSPGYVGWMWRNGLMPFLSKDVNKPPASMLPKGAIGWTHHFGEWVPYYFSDLPKRPKDYPYAYERRPNAGRRLYQQP